VVILPETAVNIVRLALNVTDSDWIVENAVVELASKC